MRSMLALLLLMPFFTVGLVFLALMLPSSAQATYYKRTDGTYIDPILYTQAFGGGIHPYSGPGLEPFADLVGADLTGAALTGADLYNAILGVANLTDANLTGADLYSADLTDALYDENTLFPSGNTYDMPPWGPPDDATPWDLGMVPAPEPASGLMLAVGGLALAAVGRRR